jgi:hypothetical protein
VYGMQHIRIGSYGQDDYLQLIMRTRRNNQAFISLMYEIRMRGRLRRLVHCSIDYYMSGKREDGIDFYTTARYCHLTGGQRPKSFR